MIFSDKQLTSYHSFLSGDLSFLDDDSAAIRISGQDRSKFLNNFCTADINRLEPGSSSEAFVLNAKGKTVAFLLVLVLEDHLVLVTRRSQTPALLEHLNKYAFLEDAELTLLDDVDIVWACRPLDGGIKTTLAEELYVHLLDKNSSENRPVTEQEIFDSFRIENKIPISGVDVLENNLAQEFERDSHAISFTKGCYLGQETVARLDALGHTNKTLRLVRCHSNNDLDLSSPLKVGDKDCGKVTSVGWSPKHQSYLAMAMIKKPNHKAGTELDWGDVKVTVVS